MEEKKGQDQGRRSDQEQPPKEERIYRVRITTRYNSIDVANPQGDTVENANQLYNNIMLAIDKSNYKGIRGYLSKKLMGDSRKTKWMYIKGVNVAILKKEIVSVIIVYGIKPPQKRINPLSQLGK